MKQIYKKLKRRNSIWKFSLIKTYLSDNEKILDLGCGDLELSKQIATYFRKTEIKGIDVIPLKNKTLKNPRISFLQYDGKKIPFRNNTFDTVIAFYVLHHCSSPAQIIKECSRVARKRVLVIESIPHTNIELPFMRFFDWFFNVIKFDLTPLPYKFYTLSKWKALFSKVGMSVSLVSHPKGYEDFLPFGKLYILEFTK